MSARCCSTTRAGEEHFNLISALHKSVRSSDPDAALYWLARMLEVGRGPPVPGAAAGPHGDRGHRSGGPARGGAGGGGQQTVHFLGVPEGDQALAQIALYLAVAPKSDAAYQALNEARETVAKTDGRAGADATAQRSDERHEGVGVRRGYQHAHAFRGRDDQHGVPSATLQGTEFYHPTDRGIEQRIAERLAEIRRRRQAARRMNMRILTILTLAALTLHAAEPPIYHLLWFDTEDYVEPSADDAALRLADELTRRGVRATFKIVGEKARVLERRNRADVIRSLARHDIGYHSDNHSIPPAPAAYLEKLGLLDGAAEFERRESPGLRDLQRIFGVTPSCYGQPGNSWAPQSNPALRRMGIRVYMDDGKQVGLDEQPFWYGGLLYIFNLGPNTIRADINDASKMSETLRRYDSIVAALRLKGGGVIQTYYHPTEFVTTEFWDGVNFRHGANPEQTDWKKPKLRTRQSSEQTYRLFLEFVDHARAQPGVRFITAGDARQLMESPLRLAPPAVARRLAESIDVNQGYSPRRPVVEPARHCSVGMWTALRDEVRRLFGRPRFPVPFSTAPAPMPAPLSNARAGCPTTSGWAARNSHWPISRRRWREMPATRQSRCDAGGWI